MLSGRVSTANTRTCGETMYQHSKINKAESARGLPSKNGQPVNSHSLKVSSCR